MKPIRIAFCDFWDGFKPESHWFYPLISKEYDTIIIPHTDNPDILFYSCFGNKNMFVKAGIRIYFTGENDVPNFGLCDYAMSFHHIQFGNRHLRLPLYALFPSFEILRNGKRVKPTLNRGFCSFVVSNNFCATAYRTDFYEQLSKYKKIASGGHYLNNIGGPVKDKHKFLTQYKFNIAFENSSVDGYTTEKLVDALAAGTLPIYWGNNQVELDFPKDCYIDVSDFKTTAEAVEYIEKVDNDNNLYMSYFQTEPERGNAYLKWESMFMQFMRFIIETRRSYIINAGNSKGYFETEVLKNRVIKFNILRNNIDFLEKIYSLSKIFKH